MRRIALLTGCVALVAGLLHIAPAQAATPVTTKAQVVLSSIAADCCGPATGPSLGPDHFGAKVFLWPNALFDGPFSVTERNGDRLEGAFIDNPHDSDDRLVLRIYGGTGRYLGVDYGTGYLTMRTQLPVTIGGRSTRLYTMTLKLFYER